MIDEATVHDEVIQESVEQEVLSDQSSVAEQPQETPQQKNFKAIKEAKEQAERERDAYFRRLQEYEHARALQASQNNNAEQPEEQLAPDDLPTASYVDKKYKKLEKQLNTYQQQAYQASVESRLKHQFPDIEKVLTTENIEMLKKTEPTVAAALEETPDIYNKAVSVYKYLKNSGIYQEDNYQLDREKALKNAQKPRPLNSIAPQQGDSPISRANAFANGLTDELRQELLKEMNQSRKGY